MVGYWKRSTEIFEDVATLTEDWLNLLDENFSSLICQIGVIFGHLFGKETLEATTDPIRW